MTLPSNFIRHPELTDDNLWYAVHSSLSHTFANPTLARFLDPLLKSYGRIYIGYDHTRNDTGAWWKPGEDPLGTYGLVILSGNIINGVLVDGVDGSPFTIDLERVLFHELAHGRLTKGERVPDLDTSFFLEQVAVFAENALYAGQFGGGERVGHTGGGLTGKSVSAVAYLDGLKYADAKVDGEKATFVFGDESNGVIKHYYRTSHMHQAGTTQHYFNYVDITRLAASGVIEDDTIPFDAVTLKILDSSIVDAPILAVATAQATVAALGAVSGSWLTTVPLADYALDQTALRTISAERFADGHAIGGFIDAFGPVDYAIRATPATFVLDGGDLSVDAVLLGAGGYHRGSIDTRASADDLLGGAGDDLLIPGLGNATILNPNRLQGGAGDDILIARPSVDLLDGGSGVDVVSYIGATAGIVIDLGLQLAQGPDRPVGLAGDALDDVIKSCEVIVGTAFDDVLKGDGSGAVLVGGAGNDEFHLYRHDVAVGGPGADKFFVYTNQIAPGRVENGSVCGIVGLDPWDEIYVNDARYTGRTVDLEMSSDGLVLVADTSAYGPVYGENGAAIREDFLLTGMIMDENYRPLGLDPAGTGVLTFTDHRPGSEESLGVYLWDYQAGDAGLHYSYDYWSNITHTIENTNGADPTNRELCMAVGAIQGAGFLGPQAPAAITGDAFSPEDDWAMADRHQVDLLNPFVHIA